MKSICRRTGKWRYRSKLDADLDRARILGKDAKHRKQRYRDTPARSYRCEFCHGWHLTSQEKGRNRAS